MALRPDKSMLSSLNGIIAYIGAPDECDPTKQEDWALLSAIQREIDKRYSVIDKRDLSAFMDKASLKGQTTRDALEYFQNEMYELAPHFLNLDYPFTKNLFNLFPMYYDKRTLNGDIENNIEHLFTDGAVPNHKIWDVVENRREDIVQRYKRFLKNVCYWLGKFRYVNACPYTFALSTFNRTWEYTRTNDSTSVDNHEYSTDIWDYENPYYGDYNNRKDWKSDNKISGDNNGQSWNGVQIEVFQWFRTRDYNLPPFGTINQFNGFPAGDPTGHVAESGSPYGNSDQWDSASRETIDQITADWSDYEWELEYEDSQLSTARHIPADLSDWVCKTRLSTLDSGWEFLEYGWENSLSARIAAQLSIGWDSVMTNEQKAHWGTTYLSCFPVTGITGKIVGIPSLSGTPEEGDFFPEKGHKMYYTLHTNANSMLYDEWDSPYVRINMTTKWSEFESYTMNKEKVPLEVTIENPTAYQADACVVAYSESLPKIVHNRRTIDDYNTVIIAMPPTQEGLRTSTVIGDHYDKGLSSYGTWAWNPSSRRNKVPYGNQSTTYLETTDTYAEHKDTFLSSYSCYQIDTNKRWTVDQKRQLLLNTTEISSGVRSMDITEDSSYESYPDSFGLLKGEPLLSSDDEGNEIEEVGISEDESGGAHQFLRVMEIDPYSYKLLFSHPLSSMPPIDFDLHSRIEEQGPDGPYFRSGDGGYGRGGIANDVLYSQTSGMRLFTFFDFGKAFGLIEEGSSA